MTLSFPLLLISQSVLGALVTVFFGLMAARPFKGGIIASAIQWIVLAQVLMSLNNVLAAAQMGLGAVVWTSFFASILPGIIFRVVAVVSVLCSIVGFSKLWLATRGQ